MIHAAMNEQNCVIKGISISLAVNDEYESHPRADNAKGISKMQTKLINDYLLSDYYLCRALYQLILRQQSH